MEFTIRPINDDDKQSAAIVHYESWLTTYNNLLENNYLKHLDKHQFLSTSSLHNTPTLVATVRNQVVGFISYGKTHEIKASDNWSEIFDIYLLEEYQHHMIGYALMQRALELSYPDDITLWVVEQNASAIRFYEQIGFEKTSDKKTVYFGKYYNEIRMNYHRNKHEI
ncbi:MULTISPECIES: GNAT family N-acetyltransferase [Staphylococcus]|uniref:GNAT family N-acetyltransferase n=1 Tax=Staphylococcus hsinchuensis TaxID=3051183 RepID=A0ABZ3EDE3_9STAP|nr:MULTISPECIES: GNAT family N-acetyltransferase [unclassified Staphylococcus]